MTKNNLLRIGTWINYKIDISNNLLTKELINQKLLIF